MPSRSPSRVPRLVDLEQEVRQAFASGKPEVAYRAALHAIEVCGELSNECARLRFEVNFGAPLCKNCEGLRAGPGIVATCYQVQKCEFSNVKVGDSTPKQARILAAFSDPQEKT